MPLVSMAFSFDVCGCACLNVVHGAFMNGSDSTIIEPEYDINTVNEYLILRFVVLPVLILIFILSLTYSLARPSIRLLLQAAPSLSFTFVVLSIL